MARNQNGYPLVPLLVGLVVGLVVGWMFLLPPGTKVLAEGQRAVPAEALLVDEVTKVTQLTDPQVDTLKELLGCDGRSEENPCCWPGPLCGERPAYELLVDIRTWVKAAALDDEDLRAELLRHVERCLDGGLVNDAGEHVCTLLDPDPCTELLDEVYAEAEKARDDNTDDAWLRVKSEFEDFPAGRAQ